jgi:hypothetical protein
LIFFSISIDIAKKHRIDLPTGKSVLMSGKEVEQGGAPRGMELFIYSFKVERPMETKADFLPDLVARQKQWLEIARQCERVPETAEEAEVCPEYGSAAESPTPFTAPKATPLG